ncbi:MAG: hypothetical protein AAFQ10_10745 [Pseudomonadota bacterium]
MELAKMLPDGPAVIAVNPGSLLASKMMKEGFGLGGNDLNIGADVLFGLALDPEFEEASGRFFDNDDGHFNQPPTAALDASHPSAVIEGFRSFADFN